MNNIEEVKITDDKLSQLFRKASRLMARSFHRRDNARHAQGHVMSILREKGSISQRELLEILDIRSSSLSELLGKLERKGMITRQRNEEDKRSFIIIPNESDELDDIDSGSSENLFSSLDDEEKEKLGEILEKMVSEFKDIPMGEGPGSGRGRGRGFGQGRKGRRKSGRGNGFLSGRGRKR